LSCASDPHMQLQSVHYMASYIDPDMKDRIKAVEAALLALAGRQQRQAGGQSAYHAAQICQLFNAGRWSLASFKKKAYGQLYCCRTTHTAAWEASIAMYMVTDGLGYSAK